ncbi:hypothetical protein L6164_028634 [Bauhinia variegata]|uniref:Uncharacterized protein n=1 Tax=Bauhinia variegata TaxID=167791 RepID=A0ACB9L6A1_BAUVA|nr:hypothetical protein L6164_028634 [Bauhinia variegata]
MDDNAVRTSKGAANRTAEKEKDEVSDEAYADDEQCDGEVWDILSRSFRQAQSLLDQNNSLIQFIRRFLKHCSAAATGCCCYGLHERRREGGEERGFDHERPG